MSSKAEKISLAVDLRQSQKWGALKITLGEVVTTYNKRLAWFEHSTKICHLNVEQYSVVSSNHRNRVREAARLSGYKISEVFGDEAIEDLYY